MAGEVYIKERQRRINTDIMKWIVKAAMAIFSGMPCETTSEPAEVTIDQSEKWVDAVALMGATAQTHQEGVRALWDSWQYYGDGDDRKFAYILATAWHESRLGVFMRELGDTSKYEGRLDLGNTEDGDGVKFDGKGYVHITGRGNYAKFSKILGVDLVADPELAMEMTNAANICVYGMLYGIFTGRRLSMYFSEEAEAPLTARTIVNGFVFKQAKSIEQDYFIIMDAIRGVVV